jgi:hypothetical protein
MSESSPPGPAPPPDPPGPRVTPIRVATPSRDADAVSCDRCGASMYRMHAVWRCPARGFKTDCCGW